MKNSHTNPKFHLEDHHDISHGTSIPRILTNYSMKRSFNHLPNISKSLDSNTLKNLTSSFPAPPNHNDNTSTASTNSHWSKIRIIYQFIVKLKHPDYKKVHRVESLNDDMDEFILNKIRHANLFGSKSNDLNSSLPSAKKQSANKENFIDQVESFIDNRELERLMRVSKSFDINKQLFEFAADGSEKAIEAMIHMIRDDIS